MNDEWKSDFGGGEQMKKGFYNGKWRRSRCLVEGKGSFHMVLSLMKGANGGD